MKISVEEQDAILQVLEFGKSFGYGNLISHLRTAWARHMADEHGFPEEAARNATHAGDFYPFLMQDDLIDRGEWDETGERYRHS